MKAMLDPIMVAARTHFLEEAEHGEMAGLVWNWVASQGSRMGEDMTNV
jgi:hypothetical protein